jgi:hypothetical protein
LGSANCAHPRESRPSGLAPVGSRAAIVNRVEWPDHDIATDSTHYQQAPDPIGDLLAKLEAEVVEFAGLMWESGMLKGTTVSDSLRFAAATIRRLTGREKR